MDTGAKTSALHVENIVELGHGHVSFNVVLNRKTRRLVHVKARIRRRGRVKSSNGHYSTRIFVATELTIGEIERTVEFSLVDRATMIHRILLGRSALEGILVDVKRRYCHDKPRKRTSHRTGRA